MASGAVDVTEEVLPSGWRAVRLRNDGMEVVLLPDKGSEIYALRSLRHGVDVLWKSPWGLRPPPLRVSTGDDSAVAWLDHYGGGWQELFPNGGDACTVLGGAQPFHGEASLAPWSYAIASQAGRPDVPEVRLALRCTRLPFAIEKRLWLEPNRPVLRLWERVTNVGAIAAPFMWGHHPAYGAPFLEARCRLEVPATTVEASEPAWQRSAGQRSAWPHAGGADLSLVPGPEARVSRLNYLVDLSDGWYALTNPQLGLGVGLAWPREVFSCIWLWQELCGTGTAPWFGTSYVMGVEPHTSHPGQGLARAIERGTARTLTAGESLEMDLAAVLFEPRGAVSGIATDGTVTFRT